MARKTVTTCDNCGDVIKEGESGGYARFIYPSTRQSSEDLFRANPEGELVGVETNDICCKCMSNLIKVMRENVKPQCLTFHEHASYLKD